MVFIAAYTNRVAHEARQLADALTATELALSRHEQLSALDGLAAAAAHELGTPLSTIALAAKEMKADIPPGPLADDVDLIIAQSARCRAILAKLRSLRSGESGDPFAAVPLGELLEEVAKPLEGLGKPIFIEIPETAGRAGVQAQCRPALRPRQSDRECHAICHDPRHRRGQLGPQHRSASPSPTTARAFPTI